MKYLRKFHKVLYGLHVTDYYGQSLIIVTTRTE